MLVVLLLIAVAASRETVEVLNDTPHTIEAYWINPDTGEHILSLTVPRGASTAVETTVGHRFEMRLKEKQEALGEYVVEEDTSVWVISLPKPRGLVVKNASGRSVTLWRLKDGVVEKLTEMRGGMASAMLLEGESLVAADSRSEEVLLRHEVTGLGDGEALVVRGTAECSGEGEECAFAQLDELGSRALSRVAWAFEAVPEEVQVVVMPNGGNNTGDEYVGRISVPARGGLAFIKRLLGPISGALSEERAAAVLDWNDALDVFDRFGRMLGEESELHDGQLLFLVPQTDFFVWPGLYPGYRVELPWILRGNGEPVVLETATLEPRLFIIDNYVTDEETLATIEWAKPHLHSSGVVKDGKLGQPDQARVSKTAWVPYSEDFLVPLFNRTRHLTQVMELSHYEPLQFLRYEGDGINRYESHHDYFGEDKFDSQRLITLFIYFKDVEVGGETVFPRAILKDTAQEGRDSYGKGPVASMADCTKGYLSKPVKNRAVMWYNLKPHGQLTRPAAVDFMSLHGACPLNNDTKLGANHWIHSVPMSTQVPMHPLKKRVQQRQQLNKESSP